MKTPDILCIGAMRSGTTFFHQLLNAHPNFFLPATGMDRYNKEFHFFDKQIEYRTLEWYKKQFSNVDHADTRAAVEITPAYATFPKYYLRSIAQIFEQNPKIVFLLRAPESRVLSHYIFEQTQFNQEVSGTIHISLSDIIHFCQSEQVIRRSAYRKTFENWSTTFGAANIRILTYDDLVRSPETALSEICRLLDMNDPKVDLSTTSTSYTNTSATNVRVDPEATTYLRWKWADETRFFETCLKDSQLVGREDDTIGPRRKLKYRVLEFFYIYRRIGSYVKFHLDMYRKKRKLVSRLAEANCQGER